MPVELLAVCVLMAAAGALTLWPALQILPDILDALGGGGLTQQLGLLLLAVWTVLAFFGAACFVLGWRLGRADRVARGLTHVLLLSLAGSILLSEQQPTALVLVMLVSFAASAVLWAAPRVQAYFAAHHDLEGEPTAVVVARTLVAVWAGCVALVGLMFLPLGGLDGTYVPVGIGMMALAVGAIVYNRRLTRGDQQARLIISTGAGIYLLLIVVLGDRTPGLILPFAIACGTVYHLWVPTEAKRHFRAV